MFESLTKWWPIALGVAAFSAVLWVLRAGLTFNQVRELVAKSRKRNSKSRLHYCSPNWMIGLEDGQKRTEKCDAVVQLHVRLYNPESYVLRVRVLRMECNFNGTLSPYAADTEREFQLAANCVAIGLKGSEFAATWMPKFTMRGWFDIDIAYGRDLGEDTKFNGKLRIAGNLDTHPAKNGDTHFEPFVGVEPPTYPDPTAIVIAEDGIRPA